MPAKSDASAFPTWDSLVADAVVDLPVYQLPLGDIGEEKDVVVEIPVPDGASYLRILDAQRRGDSAVILRELVKDEADRTRIVVKMAGAPFPIVDTLTGKVLRYYYGLSIVSEEKSGNSSGS